MDSNRAQAKADLGPNMIEIPIDKTNAAGGASNEEMSNIQRPGEITAQGNRS